MTPATSPVHLRPQVFMIPHPVLKILSNICFVSGFVSIVAAILIWFCLTDIEGPSRERLAIFVGLWPPTFFALSDRIERYAMTLIRLARGDSAKSDLITSAD